MEREKSRRTFSEQFENVITRTRLRSEKNTRDCMKSLINVSETRELSDRGKFGYPNGNPKACLNGM